MFKIKSLVAREILDSRGKPTIEVDLVLSGNIDKVSNNKNNSFGRASVPSGASVGNFEALELRDGNSRYLGFGVLKALNNVNTELARALVDKTFSSQRELDYFLIHLDGTKNKSRFGANAILAVSMAFAKASSVHNNTPLYKFFSDLTLNAGIDEHGNLKNSHFKENLNKLLPMINIINGGKHADNDLDIQEFMIIPTADVDIREKIRIAAEIFMYLGILLKERGLITNVGDEGGFAPNFNSVDDALSIIMDAVKRAGYEDQVSLALDVAANELYDRNLRTYKMTSMTSMSPKNLSLNYSALTDYYANLINKYPIISIEDPFAEDDFQGWEYATKILGKKVDLIGDDLFVTNAEKIREGQLKNIANAVLIKMNQIGTITETIEAMQTAHDGNYKSAVSHRSGETEDVTLVHLAVGAGSNYIKTGSMSRTDRVCKYNELLRIYEALN